MKRLFLIAAATFGFGTAALADPVLGLWRSEPGETGGYVHVRIAGCGGKVCGTITEVKGNSNTSIVGRQIIWDMQARGNGQYRGGKIWAPDQDKTYNSKMTMNGNSLKVEGCVTVFCRGQTWTRIN
ncbi:DUF2147 domain-containing protein [Jannaschia aquimarina]|uniref:DUF2147 domain-containing protein n=1 Tax=Jannaschia aquimarina TaxID=935700 RepID=A0A0D1EME2_9RHOB|nr:DUF2147 domain-containing protein [Jannaschia aquimarina]KIT16845.1 hypothetical protein jaqu_13420 [Jannaschia aquimarina]SNT13130.1 Uncharacterized conserved protein, DUF2147 family [Jannaschia aquimarina]